MRTRSKPFLPHFTISALAAVIVLGASSSIVQAASTSSRRTVETTAISSAQSPRTIRDDASRTATRAPRRLNVMAGNDDIAWAHVGKKVVVPKNRKSASRGMHAKKLAGNDDRY